MKIYFIDTKIKSKMFKIGKCYVLFNNFTLNLKNTNTYLCYLKLGRLLVYNHVIEYENNYITTIVKICFVEIGKQFKMCCKYDSQNI